MPEERPVQRGLAAGELSIRASKRRPTPEVVNATMARLGLPAEWSAEAVEQLAEAAAAAEEYLRRFPEEAETLARRPEAALRGMVERGFLSSQADSLQAALTTTRRAAEKRTWPRTSLRVASVRFDVSESSGTATQSLPDDG